MMTAIERRQAPVLAAASADDILVAAAPDATRTSRASPNLILAILCVGIVLANLDLFIVNVALPNIGQDFKSSSLEDLSWIHRVYLLRVARARIRPSQAG